MPNYVFTKNRHFGKKPKPPLPYLYIFLPSVKPYLYIRCVFGGLIGGAYILPKRCVYFFESMRLNNLVILQVHIWICYQIF